MWSLIRTIWNVLLHTFHKRVTIQYPEEKAYLAPRTRGRIILSRDPDGGERCVACYLCAVACPVDCIHPKKDEAGFADTDQLFIDPVECIDCGACVPVCPVSAIYAADDLPEKWADYQAKNAAYFGR